MKGHQDKDRPLDELTQMEILNIQADVLAEEYITSNPNKDYSKAIRFPHNKVQLHLSNGTVTLRLKQALRLARTTQPLVEHLKTRFGWDDDTFQDIDWEASRLGYNRLRKHRVTLIKHANNYSPVGSRVSRYDPKYSPACPACPEPLETHDHLYQCPAASRHNWRSTFLYTLRVHLEEDNTRLDVTELLLEGIKSVLEGRAATTIPVPHTLTDLAAAQSAIGWENVLRGRLSHQWAAAQQVHMGAYRHKKNGTTWLTTVIQKILQGWLDLWDLRNGERHGRDRQTKAQADRAQAVRELELLYTLKDAIMPRHNWILEVPILQRMNLKTYTLRAFINSYKPILEGSHKERQGIG